VAHAPETEAGDRSREFSERLQRAFGSPTKPAVEISSTFPPAMLLGRIDRVRLAMDQASLHGAVLYNAMADLNDLKGVDVSRCLTAGCADVDPHTPCVHDRSSRVCEGIVCMHHAKRVKHTEIRCQVPLEDLTLESESCSLSAESPTILIDQNQACPGQQGLQQGLVPGY
jgi:hypothetical protein